MQESVVGNSVRPTQPLSWQQSIAGCCVSCEMTVPAGFAGTVSTTNVGPIRCNRVNATRHRAVRSSVGDRNDAILLNRVVSGTVRVMQDGRAAVLRSGDFAMHDAARPYELEFDSPFSQLIFQLPRRILRQRLGSFDYFMVVVITRDDPLGRLVSDFLLDLAYLPNSVDAAITQQLSEYAVDLLIDSFLRAAKPIGPHSKSAYRAALLYRVKAFVDSHLGQPLTAGDIAAASLGCSSRYVSSLFADEGLSLGEYILVRRLDRCARDLVATPVQRQVREIGYAWGFSSASYFCRAFKSRFGVSPTDYRRLNGRNSATGPWYGASQA